jgi:hypothetical protein
MLKIKCAFPYNYYALRNVRIELSNGEKYSIKHLEEIIIEVKRADWIGFKLDYHKFKLPLENLNEDKYIIVTFDFRDYFPFYFLDIMFKNSIIAKIVTREEFENYEINNSFIEKKESLKWLDIVALSMNLLIGLSFVFLSIFQSEIDDSDKGFLFVIGAINFTASIRYLLNRNSTSVKGYKQSMTISFYLIIIMLIFLDLSIEIKSIILTISILTNLITAHNKGLIKCR